MMSEANPKDELFIPDVRVFISVMNGKTDMLIKNPRYIGYKDLS